MKTKRFATVMSTALIYMQGALMVAAVTAVVARLPEAEKVAEVHPVVTAMTVGINAQPLSIAQ